jgi:tetratricopeptide (TPR) repeat protein
MEYQHISSEEGEGIMILAPRDSMKKILSGRGKKRMLTKQQLNIITFMLVSLALFIHNGQADQFRILINGDLVNTGTTIKVTANSIVRYEIYQSSSGLIELDLTGDGTLKQPLSGPKATFSTIYNTGNYKPQIKSGQDTQSFTLSVSDSLQTSIAEFSKVIPQVMWPLVAFFVFLILCIFGKLHSSIKSFRLGTVEVSGVKLTSADLEVSLRQEIEKIIKNLDTEFPPEMAPQYIRFSLNPDTGYYVHILEFLRDIGFKVNNAKAWNSVGNYYFYYDKYKAKKAYNDAIALDPKDPTPYINLGMYYLLTERDTSSAKRTFEKGIDVAREKMVSVPWAHIGLSIVYWRLKSDETDPASAKKFVEQETLHNTHAKKDFEHAITLNGADFWSYCGLGWCWAEEKNYDKAIQNTSDALKIKKDFIIARYNLACHKAKIHEFKESMEDFRQLLEPMKLWLQLLEIEKTSDLQDMADYPEFQQFFKMLGLEYKPNKEKKL